MFTWELVLFPMLTNLWSTIKAYTAAAVALLIAILTALFFYEKNKAEVDGALIKQEQVNKDLEKIDNTVANNDAALAAQAQERAKLEKEKSNANPSLEDIANNLANRK